VRFDLREPRSRLQASESIRQRLLNENQIAAATLGDSAATAALTPNQRLQLASQAEEFASRREGARQELRKAEERLAGERASLATYENIANRIAGLVAQGAASEVQLLEARQNVQKSESAIAQEQREIARLESSLVNTGATTNVELRRKVEENLRQIAQLDSDIRQARQQIQFGLLTAPADGTVFDIEVSPGSVVAQGTGTSANASGKSLMKVVPNDALQARVFLPNQAIGFVQPGQRADLQIQAFDASDFGTVAARVERIGSDALPAEEQKRELGTDSTGLYYPAVMLLDRQTIQLPNSTAPLQAGMSLTANIKLRERRFINIFTGFFEDQRRNLERLR
jgi:HlyD family secretion protein